ncbi:hypothetical protein, partial [Kineococcus glutinatus]|uniref:hypothetical protein n=1 Tax=Kineococcus glutinatus TaxID=1070872 RepID=UPI0031EA9CD5
MSVLHVLCTAAHGPLWWVEDDGGPLAARARRARAAALPGAAREALTGPARTVRALLPCAD